MNPAKQNKVICEDDKAAIDLYNIYSAQFPNQKILYFMDQYQQQMMKFQGARESRMLDYQKQEMELGFAMQEKAAADQAVQAANAALYGGIGQLATTALTGGFSPA